MSKTFKRVISLIMTIIMLTGLSSYAYALNSTETPSAVSYTGLKYYSFDSDNSDNDYAELAYELNNSSYSTENLIRSFGNGLTEVTNTTVLPFSAIGYLYIVTSHFPYNVARATAYMISKNVAITAAHCVFDKSSNSCYDNVYFYPGKHGAGTTNDPFGASYRVSGGVCNDYINNTNPNLNCYYDWAVILLNDDIGNDCGTLQYSNLSYNTIRNASSILTSGYPQNTGISGLIPNYKQYKQTFAASTIMDNYMTGTTSFLSGQSGSPVMINNTAFGLISTTSQITLLTQSACSYIDQFVSDNL